MLYVFVSYDKKIVPRVFFVKKDLGRRKIGLDDKEYTRKT